MATEIERKFLVTEPPPEALACPSERIDQGYLVSDGEIEIRVRRKGDAHFLTIKKGHGGVREETEVEITAAQFEHIWPQTEGWRVEKRRHLIPIAGGHTAEMDVYGVHLERPDHGRGRVRVRDGQQRFHSPGLVRRGADRGRQVLEPADGPQRTARLTEAGALASAFTSIQLCSSIDSHSRIGGSNERYQAS